MDNKADQYDYKVFWSEEDGEYVARVSEFPSLSCLAESEEAALREIKDLVAFILEEASKDNEPMPTPKSINFTRSKEVK